jgi:hypothetical protein
MAMTPIVPDEEKALRKYLDGLRDRGPSPLAKLPRTHMGRFVIIEDFYNDPTWKQRKPEHLAMPYLVFTSNFDGDLDSYLDELSEKLAPEAKQIWGRCVGCPKNPKGTALKKYLKHNQIDTGLFFTAYGKTPVPKVKAALRQRDRLIVFARSHQDAEPEALQAAFVKEFGS